MFKNNFVVSMKVDDKILREDKESVFIPFGKEYTLLLKNFNSKTAVVSVSIDGEDMLNGKRLVIGPNSDYELKRMITNNKGVDSDRGYAFKFIEKTEQISEYRGDKIEDGIIRVEFTLEKPKASLTNTVLLGEQNAYNVTNYDYRTSVGGMHAKSGNDLNLDIASRRISDGNMPSLNLSSSTANCSSNVDASTQVDYAQLGITTKGSEVEQSFTVATVGQLEAESTVICLQMLGKVQGVNIEDAVTVKTKLTCPVCGRINSSNFNYCGRCGTNLK